MKKNKIQLLGMLFVFVATLGFCTVQEVGETGPVIEPLTKSWEIVVPHQEIPEGLSSLSAKQCGACHQDHYAEWKLSTHANAWTDLQFQAELKKETSPFFCINCHIPLENQQEYIVSGMIDGDIYQPVKEKNPHWDKELQEEGITCAACHVRNNAIVGPTGTSLAPHKTVKDVKHLSETLCISCHNATAVITPTLACSFETGDEWNAGPYSGKKNCISCHMEEVNRAVVPGYEPRKSHFHSFPGSGIPKHDTLKTNMLNGLAFYPGKIANTYSTKDEIVYTFKAKNEHAGHRVPTGDPERFIIIDFRVIDTAGEEVAHKEEYIGEEWQWHPTAKKLSDNNYAPLEERIYQFEMNDFEKGKYSFIVEVTKHRMNPKTAEYNRLGAEYPLKVSIFKEVYNFSIK